MAGLFLTRTDVIVMGEAEDLIHELCDALALARRLQRSLRRVRIGDIPLTTSIGYAVFPENGTTPEALLAHADSALWRSKHESRAAEAS